MKSNTKKQELHAILISFTQSNPTQSQVADCARSLQHVLSSSLIMTNAYGEEEKDDEEVALEDAIVRKLTIAIYADTLNTYLAQAIEVEAEAECWARVERSKLAVAFFLLQSTFFIFAFIVPEDITFFFFGSVSLTSHECI